MGIDYLRLSLTDRCDLNCVYCAPLEKGRFLPRGDVLTHEETAEAAAAFVEAGVRKIRLTGGEPLLRKDIAALARMLRAIPGLRELALTTNGVRLAGMAGELRAAGVDRVNISIDALNRETFRRITGSDRFDAVWRGVQEALKAGFSGVKLNVVLIKGLNDGEIADFAKLTIERPLTVRFIELFPANGRAAALAGAMVPSAAVMGTIEKAHGKLQPAEAEAGGGPALCYRLKGAKGGLGFISGRSGYFCGSCNRVRMDCSGGVYPCLFSPPVLSLRGPIRSGAPRAELARLIKEGFAAKPKYAKDSGNACQVEMSSIGG